ncbi:unnamed protein product [Chironomus riparius]|uniref:Odorant receptor n=1 Tax=Chironomus riparius TaxID=315576 RepID=A0A9N9WWM5_9DIPT|nr:unnamed protein product [Chironomus riparius]
MSLPSQENFLLRMVVIKISKLIGANLKSRQLFSWQQKAILIIQLIALATQINGLISVWPNVAEICNSLIVWFFGVQTITRGISTFTKNDEKICPEIEKIIDNFFQKSEKNEKFRQILLSHLRIFKPIVLAFLAVYFISSFLPIITGWIMTSIGGEVKLFLPIKFPYIDLNNIFGYLFVQFFLALLAMTLFAIIATGDVYNFYLTLQTVLMVKILNCQFDKLGEDLIKVRELEEKTQKLRTKKSKSWDILLFNNSIFYPLRMMIVKMLRLIGASLPNGKLLSVPQIIISIIQAIAISIQINGLIKLWPNRTELIRSIILYLLGTQTIIRGISRFTRDDEKALKEINGIIDKLYGENEKDEKFCQSLSSNVKLFRKLILTYLITCCIFYHLPAATGWILTLMTGEFVLPMPLKFPYIDSYSTFGFLLCLAFTTLVSTTLFLIIAAGDTANLYFTLQTITMVDMFVLKLQFLGEDLIRVRKLEIKIQNDELSINSKPSQKVGKASIDLKLKNLKVMQNFVDQQFIRLINDYNTYNDYISRIFSFRELITFTTLYLNFIGIGLSLVTIKFSSISFGIATGMIFTLQVFMHCVEGTLVSIQNDKLLAKVQDFPWYKLSHPQKKIFLQFLCICQSTNSFSLPIFGDVNMELFKDIMQATYSFLMCIIQFVN